ncbi:MAG: glycosyltransferase [Candidatus Omnitrophica bacterium]|nr:glycosyltransferase [Candidatus Omnitrophota bacterium]
MTFVFVVDAFPTVSETFILNQITGLIDLGHEVLIFSAARPDERDFHDDIRAYDLLKKTYYHNDRPGKLMRILWGLLLIILYGPRNPKAVLNSLNFFKYGKEALSLTYFYKVMLFLGVGKIDIILCHYGPNGNFAVLMKELGIKGKLVTMFHGYDIRRGIEHGGKIYAPLFQQGDAFLSISDYNYKHLVEFGAPVEKIHAHPVGIDLQRYVFSPRHPPEGPIKILTVSRLIKEKGMAYGLEAIHKLIHERGLTHIEYCILGDGPQRQELEAMAEQFGLKGKVYFLGYQIQAGVIKMLQQSHIFFLPSVAEALPVVLMEAQAAGIPVVATHVGSVAQVMADGRSGFLVPAMDVNAMCDKLEYLVRNPGQWAAMGTAGCQHVQERYDIKKLNQRLVDLCQGLLRS